MIVDPTLCGSCYWEITSAGVLNIYGSDEDVDEYVLDSWASKPPWYDYRTQIKEVRVESDYVCPQTLYRAFYGCSALTTVVIKRMDLSYCTSLGYMFRGCVNLASATFSNFDTSTITDMSSMFYNCQSLTALNLLSWDTSSVTTMAAMFRGCTSLASLIISGYNGDSEDIIGWDTSALTAGQHMFYGCSSLTAIDLNSFDVSKVESTSYMFYSCSSLTTIYAGDWTSEAVSIESSYYMFSGCSALEGAISYNGSKLGITYANYETGYFTEGGIIISGTTSGSSGSDDTEIEYYNSKQKAYGLTGSGVPLTITKAVTSLSELSIYYESASGNIVDFNGDTLWIQEPETLFKSVWSCDSYDSAYGGGKVTRFYRPVEESDEVSLEVVADSYADYVDIVDEAHNIFESDIRNLTPGKLWINGAYRECYIHSRSYTDFDIVLASATMDVSALYTGESWIEEMTLEAADIAEATESLSDGTGIMRPVDVDVSSPAGFILSLDVDYPSYPLITFYGPAESPWVTIGTEFYQCRQTIYEGEYIVYDAKNRTVTGYIESAREPDENSYSVGVPDDWESGLTLYRAVLITDESGASHYIGGDDLNVISGAASEEIDDVILSAESEYLGFYLKASTYALYMCVDDILTLGSGDEDTARLGASISDYFDGYSSIFTTDNDDSLGDFPYTADGAATITAKGDTTLITMASALDSNGTVAGYCQTLDILGIDSDTAEIGILYISGTYDYCTFGFVRIIDGSAEAAVTWLTIPVGEYATASIDIDGIDGIITWIYFGTKYSSSVGGSLSAGDYARVAGGFVTPQGMHPVSGQTVYACDAVGEKNWFEYRNLDLDPFEPIQPGESDVYFESDTTFDLIVLQERSEPPWT